ncbi:M13 family metallopeptidase [Shewanella surugensis]|uniref:M13 family metallopeptidase n=1 Tax=Shewanella surugensis TaxID=212020 RepID=A0ABT0L6F9_9GAMM|nr:M13 family metallopeptidase [Shewanella surugensis]MCL1122952.1 M13 family metallopeptidase [Shewanella surugensis]
MKKIVLGGLCASLIVGLTACDNDKPAPEIPQSRPTNTETVVKKVLSSGVDFSNFDLSVRPQDNFYYYVNGTWIKNTKIPSDRTSIGAFYDLRDKSQEDIKTIIASLAAADNLTVGSDEQKVADLYRSFMDVNTLDKLGVKPIQNEFHKIAAINSTDELMDYFAHSQIIGGVSPLNFYIDIDAKDSKRYVSSIWQDGLSLPDKDYYTNTAPRFVKIRQAFLKHIETMYTLAGLADPKASAEKVLALETDLAASQWDVVDIRDSTKTYNLYKITDLPKLAPDINWQAYLAAMGASKASDVVINQPSYIEGLGQLIKTTDLATWKTYLQWQLLSNMAGDLNAALDNEHFVFFDKVLNGQETPKPRWKRGVDIVNSQLGEIVGKVYVKRYFSPAAKTRMQELVENLRQAYGDSIDALTWMSDTTQTAAQEKLAQFTAKIGYPDKWKNYDALKIKVDDLVGNSIRASEFEHQNEMSKLGGPIRQWEWFMTPQTVNAYYNPAMNEIVFPAAILQPPFFDMQADDAVNYGGIGAVIGHEMGHGFDDQGAKFDGKGNMTDWWTEQDLEKFTEKGEALIAQYDGYSIFEGLNVNGKLTLGENIGDLSGLTIAYRAYKKSLKGQQAPVIDGLTGDQRFFIGFAQVWRSKIKEETMRNLAATDPHSPAEFRCLGALSNMPAFYRTFGVKPDDAMYIPPGNRVKIW